MSFVLPPVLPIWDAGNGREGQKHQTGFPQTLSIPDVRGPQNGLFWSTDEPGELDEGEGNREWHRAKQGGTTNEGETGAYHFAGDPGSDGDGEGAEATERETGTGKRRREEGEGESEGDHIQATGDQSEIAFKSNAISGTCYFAGDAFQDQAPIALDDNAKWDSFWADADAENVSEGGRDGEEDSERGTGKDQRTRKEGERESAGDSIQATGDQSQIASKQNATSGCYYFAGDAFQDQSEIALDENGTWDSLWANAEAEVVSKGGRDGVSGEEGGGRKEGEARKESLSALPEVLRERKRKPGKPVKPTGDAKKDQRLALRRERRKVAKGSLVKRGRGRPRGHSPRSDAPGQWALTQQKKQLSSAVKTLGINWKKGMDDIVAMGPSKLIKKHSPALYNATVVNVQNQIVVANSSSVMQKRGRGHGTLVTHLGADLEYDYLAKMCNTTVQYVRNLKSQAAKAKKKHQEDHPGTDMPKAAFETLRYPVGVRRVPRFEEVRKRLHKRFFETYTSKKSGDDANSNTFKLGIPVEELHQLCYAEYPMRLREECVSDPTIMEGVLAMAKNASTNKNVTITRFGKNVLSAWAAQSQDGFDQEQEYCDRKDFIENEYSHKLSLSTSFRVKVTKPPVREAFDQLEFDVSNPTAWNPVPPDRKTFWEDLKQLGIKWNRDHNPHACETHKEGPAHILRQEMNTKLRAANREQFAITSREISGLAAAVIPVDDLTELVQANRAALTVLRDKSKQLDAEYLQLQADASFLLQKVNFYHKHIEQYETARKQVKIIEKNLKPGEVLVYRDFVNQHSQDFKCSNLVYVLLWRSEEGGVIHVQKVNNFCTDPATSSCDAFYVRDVLNFHGFPSTVDPVTKKMVHSGLFDDFHTIYFSGDHGPHFTACDTFLMEMEYCKASGKTIHHYFLCSYHAYNRCDGAGCESKVEKKRCKRKNCDPATGQNFTDMMNNSQYENSDSYNFKAISHNLDILKTNNAENLNLRSQCEVRFTFKNEEGVLTMEDGIVLARLCSKTADIWDFTVIDCLVRPKDGRICSGCSNRKQRPIWHGKERCPGLELRKKGNRAATVDPDRIQG
jgi:hypothetical protein